MKMKAQRHRNVILTLWALCSVVTWTGALKLTPCSEPVWAPTGVKMELTTPEEDLGAVSGNKLTAPGRPGAAPGSKAAGLIVRLA